MAFDSDLNNAGEFKNIDFDSYLISFWDQEAQRLVCLHYE